MASRNNGARSPLEVAIALEVLRGQLSELYHSLTADLVRQAKRRWKPGNVRKVGDTLQSSVTLHFTCTSIEEGTYAVEELSRLDTLIDSIESTLTRLDTYQASVRVEGGEDDDG